MKLWKMIRKNITSFAKSGFGAFWDKLNASIAQANSCTVVLKKKICRNGKMGGGRGRAINIEQQVTQESTEGGVGVGDIMVNCTKYTIK
mmetsp:Transcript_34249/g.49743  ORF Transcript_34249/g.49743 Transcript_34249/m.49743 type:complete len:89 (+) Transcript_34249:362-628(+)